MTPMIDIVFQLLVFFVMTYKVTVMEGDFNIKMPMAAEEPQKLTETLEEPLLVTLIGDEDRNLQAIEVDFGGSQFNRFERDPANPKAVFDSLRNFVIAAVRRDGDPGSGSEIEAEVDAAYDLRYEETIKAIEAMSGYRNERNEIVKLIEKIKFKDTGQ